MSVKMMFKRKIAIYTNDKVLVKKRKLLILLIYLFVVFSKIPIIPRFVSE